MIKRKGQHREHAGPSPLRRMSDVETTAYSEAFGAIKSDYQTLCLIGEKLREVETTARGLGPIDSQTPDDHIELPDSANGRSAWEVCASLMRLNNNEVFLCKRICEHGVEYAVIDHAPVASEYARANGRVDILQTSDNPRRVLREYLRNERQTLELMVNDMTANVRLLIAERFPKQDLRRVVNAITNMCKNVACLGFSETTAELTPHMQKQGRGVRV